MKNIKFTISERLRLMAILNEFKGNLETLASLMEDIKKIRIDDSEWEKAERVIETVKNEKGEDSIQWKWNDEKAGEKEIGLEKETVKYIQEAIEKKDKAGEMTLQDIVLVNLSKKIK